MRWLSASTLLIACLFAMPARAQHPLVGTVTYVREGDTICGGSTEVRLEGMDAPESKENCRRWGRLMGCKCGPPATEVMRQMVEGRTVRCEPIYCDPHGR